MILYTERNDLLLEEVELMKDTVTISRRARWMRFIKNAIDSYPSLVKRIIAPKALKKTNPTVGPWNTTYDHLKVNARLTYNYPEKFFPLA